MNTTYANKPNARFISFMVSIFIILFLPHIHAEEIRWKSAEKSLTYTFGKRSSSGRSEGLYHKEGTIINNVWNDNHHTGGGWFFEKHIPLIHLSDLLAKTEAEKDYIPSSSHQETQSNGAEFLAVTTITNEENGENGPVVSCYASLKHKTVWATLNKPAAETVIAKAVRHERRWGSLITNDDFSIVDFIIPQGNKISKPYNLTPIFEDTAQPVKFNETFSTITESVCFDIVPLPVEIVSRDKFFAGSIAVGSYGIPNFELKFIGPNGEDFGRHDPMGAQGSTGSRDDQTNVFYNYWDILSPRVRSQVDTQKIWFVRESGVKDNKAYDKMNFYTAFDSFGEVTIELYLKGESKPLGKITHRLTPAKDFADVIDYVDNWIKGTSFDFSGGDSPPPLALRKTSAKFSIDLNLHNLTRPALIPFFNVITQIEGLTAISNGLFDGVKAGFEDDWALCKLIGSGFGHAGGWAVDKAYPYLLSIRNDPLARAIELKQLADKICQEWVFKPMEQIQADLSTWEGFKNRSWRAWNSVKGTTNKAWVIAKDSWGSICTGFSSWMEDFGARMIEGAEKNHWSEQVMVMDKFQQITNAATITGCYALGYSTGYIAEQAAVGVLTGGTIKVSTVLVKGGITFTKLLAARRVLPVVARLQFLKKWAASTAISIEMKVAVERGLVIAAETPLSLIVKDSAAEVMERGMARATFERTAFSNSKVLDEVIAALNIKKLILTPGREGQFWYKFALFFEVMGDKATAPASKGWVKAYNKLLKFNGDVLENDRAGDLLALYRTESLAPGREALRKSLDDFAANANPAALHPDLKFLDIDKVSSVGYRYVSEFSDLQAQGWKFTPNTGKGWYCTLDEFSSPSTAAGKLQIPILNSNAARYRVEFEIVPLKDHALVPYGRWDNAEWLEPLARDFPEFGAGGASQFLIKGHEIPIKKIWDISTTPPTLIFQAP